MKDWKTHFPTGVNFKGCANLSDAGVNFKGCANLSWSLLYTILHSHIRHN